jgi:GxxExxY protein
MDESLAKQSDDPWTYAIIGAAMEVHRELGHGFLEAVYHEALAVEMSRSSILYVREPVLQIHYKGQLLNTSYRADFIAYQEIVVELKAVSQLTGVDQAQVINYLKSTGYHRALLFNFGAPRLEYKRLVW